jgi:hypothetical protein
MKVTDAYIQRLAREWTSAYEAANGKEAPTVFWINGWFRIDRKKIRRKQLEDMRDVLRMRALISPADRNP